MTYEQDSPVEVRFPRDKTEELGPRENWSWFPGYVMQQCDDEYQICVDFEIIEDGETTCPVVYRDSTEIRELVN